jgi:hypothetical protein
MNDCTYPLSPLKLSGHRILVIGLDLFCSNTLILVYRSITTLAMSSLEGTGTLVEDIVSYSKVQGNLPNRSDQNVTIGCA